MDKKNTYQAVIAVALIFICGIGYLIFGVGKAKSTDTGEGFTTRITDAKGSIEPSPTILTTDNKVYIHILGAVKNPGVYDFDNEPRVIEVVKKAGGFTKKADQSSINLAEVISDGCQIVIESKSGKKSVSVSEDTKSKTLSSSDDKNSSDKVNINTASKDELMTIPGIGDAKASSVISYRDEHGRFDKIEDIMQIPGIKDGVFSKIKDHICV